MKLPVRERDSALGYYLHDVMSLCLIHFEWSNDLHVFSVVISFVLQVLCESVMGVDLIFASALCGPF